MRVSAEKINLSCRRMCAMGVPAAARLQNSKDVLRWSSEKNFQNSLPIFRSYPIGDAPKDFVYLLLMAAWVSSTFTLPWEEHQPLDVIDYFAGAARIAKCATIQGFNARAYDLLYDCPPEGESSHSHMSRRSAFDFCGEAGFWFLNLIFLKNRQLQQTPNEPTLLLEVLPPIKKFDT